MSEPRVNAKKWQPGEEVSLGARAMISAIGGPAEEVHLGDNVFIGDDVRILAPRVHIGDFCVIHHHTTIYGYDTVVIGACSWVGQNVILNCTAPLTIGRGCTISAYSTLWTHFSGGDPLEGCNFNQRQAATVGDDAWIGVQCSIAPVTVGEKALILAGSVVTKDVPANRTWGGNPAADLTDKLGEPFSARPLKDRFGELCELLREYHHSLRVTRAMASGLDDEEFARAQERGRYRLGGITIAMEDGPDHGTSVFDVRDRTYSKLRSPEEVGFMNFLLPLVKFYPREDR